MQRNTLRLIASLLTVFLAAAAHTHTIVVRPTKDKSPIGDDTNTPLPGGSSLTTWRGGRAADPLEITTIDGGTRDIEGWEVLWHELIHACHTARGTRDTTETGPNQRGWEEVFTIKDMNKLRDWYNEGRVRDYYGTPIRLRDPYGHGWSEDLDPKNEPARPSPPSP